MGPSDIRKKHQVPLVFLLDEEVTPQLFAEKIARACSGGALRPGEGIRVPGSEGTWVITAESALWSPLVGAFSPGNAEATLRRLAGARQRKKPRKRRAR